MGFAYEDIVNYNLLDEWKIFASQLGDGTNNILDDALGQVMAFSRGESAFLLDIGDRYLACTCEGVGTKNLVITEIEFESTKDEIEAYNCIGRDNVAMIANDLITLGARPSLIGTYFAIGSNELLKNENIKLGIFSGIRDACLEIKAVMGPGDTPIEYELIREDSFSLSGFGLGMIKPKKRVVPQSPKIGDKIVFLTSSGIHANGLSAMRRLAKSLPDGYYTDVGEGKNFWQWLLTPTIQYTPFIMDCLDNQIQINAICNITGHGFRKVMRCNSPVHYFIEKVPQLNCFWEFILDYGVDLKEAYRTYNMGAGYMMTIPSESYQPLLELHARSNPGFEIIDAGFVQRSNDYQKRVTISTSTICDEYNQNDLKLR